MYIYIQNTQNPNQVYMQLLPLMAADTHLF